MVSRRSPFTVRYNSIALRRALKRTPGALRKWIIIAFNQHGQVYKVRMHSRFGASLDEGRNTTTRGFGGRLATRSGALAGTIGYDITGRGNLNTIRLHFFIGNSATIKYATTQEGDNGSAVVITGKPWLAVPLPPALTPTGRSRIERPALIQGTPGWTLRRSKKGELLIGKVAADGSFEPWWVLKKRVTIPPRLGFARTVFSPSMQKDRLTRVRVAMAQALKDATRK